MRKGHTNNPNGRPPGTPNKATQRVKSVLQEVFNKEYTADKIRSCMAFMDDMDKLRFLVQLLPYLAPKHRPEDTAEVLPSNFSRVDLSKLTDDELRSLEAIQQKIEYKEPGEVKQIQIELIEPKKEYNDT